MLRGFLKFNAPCNFGGSVQSIQFIVGNPSEGKSPIGFQSKWLNTEKGGQLDPKIEDGIGKIAEIATSNGMDVAELTYYSLNAASEYIENYKRRKAEEEKRINVENHNSASASIEETESAEDSTDN